MPIWLRRFTFETLKEYYEKQNEESKKQQNALKNKNDVNRPNISPNVSAPTYTVKAPKK